MDPKTITEAEKTWAKDAEKSAKAKRQADAILENNKGDQLRAWVIAEALVAAFEEGVQFEREAQAIRQHEGRMAGRG